MLPILKSCLMARSWVLFVSTLFFLGKTCVQELLADLEQRALKVALEQGLPHRPHKVDHAGVSGK